MVLNAGANNLGMVFKFNINGFNCSILKSTDADIKCLKCNQIGHLAGSCPQKESGSRFFEQPRQNAAGPAPSAATARTAEKPCSTKPVPEKHCLAKLYPEKPCSAKLVLEEQCSTKTALRNTSHGTSAWV